LPPALPVADTVAIDVEIQETATANPRLVPFWTSRSMIRMLPAWSTVPMPMKMTSDSA
jgi:hypothetical protein